MLGVLAVLYFAKHLSLLNESTSKNKIFGYILIINNISSINFNPLTYLFTEPFEELFEGQLKVKNDQLNVD